MIRISRQVEEFIRCLAPVPRRKLRLAIRDLGENSADVKSFEDRLSGFQRLRCGSYRVVFATRVVDGVPVHHCLFAEHRSIVYEAFERMMGE